MAKTPKTTCEEVADILETFIGYKHIGEKLRAEGRELMLYRKLARDVSYGTDKRRIAATLALQVMASDIQKEGMKK